MHLDHVNIHARDQEAMRDFFIAVLGVEVGWRPGFDFPGYWLYLDGQPVIHLQDNLRPPGPPTPGWADHVAFGPFDDIDAQREKLKTLGFPFTETRLPDSDIGQFFVQGPEGVKIEIQCRVRA